MIDSLATADPNLSLDPTLLLKPSKETGSSPTSQSERGTSGSRASSVLLSVIESQSLTQLWNVYVSGSNHPDDSLSSLGPPNTPPHDHFYVPFGLSSKGLPVIGGATHDSELPGYTLACPCSRFIHACYANLKRQKTKNWTSRSMILRSQTLVRTWTSMSTLRLRKLSVVS